MQRLVRGTHRWSSGASAARAASDVLVQATLLLVGLGLSVASLRADEVYFPTSTWETVGPEDVGWNTQKLNGALDFAMSRKSSSVVILYGGRILAERHGTVDPSSVRYRAMVKGTTSDGHVIEDVASVQKSVVSLLVGVAIEKGYVKLKDPVQKHLGVGWSQATRAQEEAIELRHLLTMTSGLSSRLQYVAPPGAKWSYNSTAYSKCVECLEKATEWSANELTERWLTQKIGMEDSRWMKRPWTERVQADANTVGLATSARDLARFGWLVQNGGRWRDKMILSDSGYLKMALAPSQEKNPAYGFLWWLNGQNWAVRGRRRVEGMLVSSAPRDLVAGLGALGRKCYIVPSWNLVVTRLGDDPNERGQPGFDTEFWRLMTLARQ